MTKLWSGVAGAALVAVVLSTGPGEARAQAGEDYLLKQPRVTLGLRAGYAVPRAESDIFTFTREQLTVEEDDFNAPSVGLELAFRLDERLDLALGVDYARSETTSEFREFVGTDDLPIVQTTVFDRTAITAGVRAYLKERGRSVGRFAWIPGSWSPFVGAGAGWMNYTFEQDGEFVDFETLDIFQDRFRSSGWTPTLHALAGVDVSLSPRFVLKTEGRYSWGSMDLAGDFVGFDEIDLSGFQVSLGVSARF